MSKRTFIACHQRVSVQHSSPPNSFLDQLVDTIDSLPDDVFEINNLHDIYAVMRGALGPYTGLLHRKAVMCEVLRVVAAFESDWRWDCGVDVNNDRSMTHKEGEETGAFQVSWDSMAHDPSLSACVDRHAHAHDPDTFIVAMKGNHALSVEYCARLLRFSTRWCGTLNDTQQVMAHVRSDAVAEFQGFLQPRPAPAFTALDIVALAPAASGPDGQFIDRLMRIARDMNSLDDAQRRAAAKLLRYDGEHFPTNACAITLATLLQDAGIAVPDLYRALALGNHLQINREWVKVDVGDQQPGDVGSTCGAHAQPGNDHIYLVLQRLDHDKMLVADNQNNELHERFTRGHGTSTTTFFLRAPTQS